MVKSIIGVIIIIAIIRLQIFLSKKDNKWFDYTDHYFCEFTHIRIWIHTNT